MFFGASCLQCIAEKGDGPKAAALRAQSGGKDAHEAVAVQQQRGERRHGRQRRRHRPPDAAVAQAGRGGAGHPTSPDHLKLEWRRKSGVTPAFC